MGAASYSMFRVNSRDVSSVQFAKTPHYPCAAITLAVALVKPSWKGTLRCVDAPSLIRAQRKMLALLASCAISFRAPAASQLRSMHPPLAGARAPALYMSAAATATAAAASQAAEEHAIKPGGGSAADASGGDGVEPVVSAALAAAGSDADLVAKLQQAVDAARARSNCNAEKVADAIILVCLQLGAEKPSMAYQAANRVKLPKK